MNLSKLTYNVLPDWYGVHVLLYEGTKIGAIATLDHAKAIVRACQDHQAAVDDEAARAELAKMMVLGPQYSAAFIMEACQGHKKLTEERNALIAAMREIKRATLHRSVIGCSAIEDMAMLALTDHPEEV